MFENSKFVCLGDLEDSRSRLNMYTRVNFLLKAACSQFKSSLRFEGVTMLVLLGVTQKINDPETTIKKDCPSLHLFVSFD